MPSRHPQRARARPPQPYAVTSAPPYADMHALASIMGGVEPSARIPVTDSTVRGLPAVDACVDRISNAVAQMMVGAQVLDAAELPASPTPEVVVEPCVIYPGSFDFWREAVAHALMQGNYVAIKTDFGADGYPRQVVPVAEESVHAYVDPDGFVVYDIGGFQYEPAELVHVRYGHTRPGNPWAEGKIDYHRRTLAGMLDQQGMSASLYREGAVPSGIIQIDADVPTVSQREYVEDQWVARYGGGASGRRVPAVMGRRMSFTPISWTPEQAEFINARQFTVAEAALMFGLRPEDLGASIGGSGLTYGNRQDDALQRIVDAYAPIMSVFEQAWSRLVPGAKHVKGNPEALLRSTTRERLELRQLAQTIGVETAEESRVAEGRPALKGTP